MWPCSHRLILPATRCWGPNWLGHDVSSRHRARLWAPVSCSQGVGLIRGRRCVLPRIFDNMDRPQRCLRSSVSPLLGFRGTRCRLATYTLSRQFENSVRIRSPFFREPTLHGEARPGWWLEGRMPEGVDGTGMHRSSRRLKTRTMFSAHSRAGKPPSLSKRTSQSSGSPSRTTKNAALSSRTANFPSNSGGPAERLCSTSRAGP